MGKNFSDIGYDDFRKMAADESLSLNEKIGFPDSYRQGYEEEIAQDILMKLPELLQQGKNVLDIGPGCAALPRWLIDLCIKNDHTLVLVDSPEMLALLPESPLVSKIPGFFPDCHENLNQWKGCFDVVICYSVFHYIFLEASFWRFVDHSIQMLANGGMMLIGDIPNISKRKRFFSSASGIRFHQEFMQTSDRPKVDFNVVEIDKLDDAVMLSVVMRARAQGCDAYLLPQSRSLPMANRREDILICKP